MTRDTGGGSLLEKGGKTSGRRDASVIEADIQTQNRRHVYLNHISGLPIKYPSIGESKDYPNKFIQTLNNGPGVKKLTLKCLAYMQNLIDGYTQKGHKVSA